VDNKLTIPAVLNVTFVKADDTTKVETATIAPGTEEKVGPFEYTSDTAVFR